MANLNDFLPKTAIEGKAGYYPVMTAQEWDDLPDVYKSMQWFPVTMKDRGFEETVFVEYVEFDVVYMEPYKIRAKVLVHRQEVQKILYCSFRNVQCQLYTISAVVFSNGVKRGAKWLQDSRTGSYCVHAMGKQVGIQGGYMSFIPDNIEQTDGGWKHIWQNKSLCHYTLTNPFNR